MPPAVAEADRAARSLVVRWTTDVPADSAVEYAPVYPPYTDQRMEAGSVTQHAIRLEGLRPNTLYHVRARSKAADHRPLVSRDFAVVTRPDGTNLLVNPDFESGTGASPRKTIPGWSKSETLDMGSSDGTWFGELKPLSGRWLFQGALNGSSSDGAVYQRVNVTPGQRYTFTAWVLTQPLERINNQVGVKYDVWNNRNRLISVRVGLDPQGGNNPAAASVEWTPRMYSHLHYSPVAKTVTARQSTLTAFVHFKGEGVEWHLYGLDACTLTLTEPLRPRFLEPAWDPAGTIGFRVASEPGVRLRLESSLDLRNWVELTNTLNPLGSFRLVDPAPLNSPARFYRGVSP